MITTILTAIVAGLASAVMFASVASGAAFSLLLFYLAPLPLMVAALGWSSTIALVGAVIATLGLGITLSVPYALAFAVTVALPAVWLAHLTLLARPVADAANNSAPTLHWYPTGRILAWIAAFASLTTICAMFTLGTDEAAINATLRAGLTKLLSVSLEGPDLAASGRAIEALVALAPVAATFVALLTLTLNLWLAAKITLTSQRLKRPWPDLRTTELPTPALAVLGITLIATLAGGLVAMASKIISASLLMAYGLLGFATLHTVTQAISGRAIVLGGTYALTLFIGWPMVAAIFLGLSDAAFGIRRRYWQRQNKLPTTG